MRRIATVEAIVLTVLLSSCAGGDATDGSAQVFSPAQKTMLHLANITAEASIGVPMKMEDFGRIVGRLKEEIRAEAPHVLQSRETSGSATGLTMKLVFTEYEGGGVAFRFERHNVGIAQIDANVSFIDANGKTVGKSKVAAYFGTGGQDGSTTDILNVEEDFEADVVSLLR